MGIDSRNINRGACTHHGCTCADFQRSSASSKCSDCSHPPTNHKVIDSSQQSSIGGDKLNRPDVAPHNTYKGGLESHAAAPSGGYSNWVVHGSQPHHHWHLLNEVIDRSGWKTCSRCSTGYSVVDLRACPECCPRESCKNDQCDKPAFYTLDLGSFGYCSAECRDRCELERAKRELTRALEEFEVNPERGSTQSPAKEPVNHDEVSQPLTRTRLQSEDTPTEGATQVSPPTQQLSPPQGPASIIANCKLSKDAVWAMSFYDRGRLHTVRGTKGILVTSIEVNKATLNCGLRPLDLITQFDGKSVESLCDKFGQCFLKSKTMQSTDVWVARTSGVPPMLGLQIEGLTEPHQSSRKHRVVGFLVTQKDLEDPASYLGVRMHEYSKRKVERVEVASEGYKAGLHENDIIQSVTVVTAEGVVVPDKEWDFEGIKRVARDSPSVCALLLTVMNF